MKSFTLSEHNAAHLFPDVLSWVNLKCLSVLLVLSLSAIPALAQSVVKGSVSDGKGELLVGVTVRVKGTSTGSTTNSQGQYEIAVPGLRGTLQFSYIGFQTKEVEISGEQRIDVAMQEDHANLKGIVVIGYGTQSKDLVTSAISKMDTMVLKNVPYTNAAYALQGTLPGVRVTSTSGQPGASPTIVVRGGTSLDPNTSYPLYVIDGVISPDLSGINSADIESIQVLKDAAATAIYGARGSNGVVIVTTKSGHPGRTVIQYDGDFSLSWYGSNTFKMLDARQFIYYNRLAIAAASVKMPSFAGVLTNASSAGIGNDLSNQTFYTPQYLNPDNAHKLKEGWQSMPDPLDPSKTIIFQNTNWRDLMYRTAFSQNHNISASGGTDKATYRMSLGYLDNDGIARNTGYNRVSVDTKGSVKLRDNLKVFSHVLYNEGHTTGVDNESLMFGRLLQIAPTVKYRMEDGSLAPQIPGNKGNPLYRENIIEGSGSMDKLTLTLGGEWNILPGLTFTPTLSSLKTTQDSWMFVKSNYNGVSYDDTRSAQENIHNYTEYQINAVFDYQKTLKQAHNLDITAGYSYLGTEEKSLGASGRGAATDLIPTLNASAIPVGVSSAKTQYIYTGYFARVNYNYKRKYIVSLSSRYDGSSNLGDDYRWGLFPGISMGWNVHKEKFWNNLSRTISELKLRASYGVNGNVNGIGAYQAQGSYSVGAIYDGVSAVQNTDLANPDLKWEQAKTIDAGLDLGFLQNRVAFSFDVYRRVTSNMIASRTLPQLTGFTSIVTNLGSVQNKGVELSLDVQALSPQSAFQWNFSVNAAYVKNKILKLPPNGIKNNRIGGIYVWDAKSHGYQWKGGLQEGGTMGDLYGYKQEGLYQSDKDAKDGPLDIIVYGADKTKFAGDVIWMDADKNDTIDERDQVYMGNIYPKWTGGLINTFSYKNFYLTVRLDFMTGQTIYDYMRATTTGQFAGDLGLSADAAKSWLKPGDKTDIPRLYYGDYQQNLSRGSSLMFEKGNYLNIREVTLSYELPKTLLRKAKIENVRVNLSAHNLHYFTGYKGINPENGGTDNGSYPISSDVIFGIHLTL